MEACEHTLVECVGGSTQQASLDNGPRSLVLTARGRVLPRVCVLAAT
jgi:hypothetical protein